MEQLVSVIIPVYKVEQYLNRCMETVIGQTYKNLEIILVDDGSPDNCPALCDEWAKKDERITVIHKKNGGLSSARNAALDVAKGEFICFVDSDDWVDLEYIRCLHEMIASSGADAAFCDFDQVREMKKPSQPVPVSKVLDKEELMRLFFRIDGGKSSYAVWRGLYKAELIEGMRFIEGIITEDVPFTYEVYSRCVSAAFTNRILYHYFVNASGITYSPVSKKDLVLFDIWDNIVNKAPEEYKEWAVLNRKRATFSLYVKSLLHGKTDDITKEMLSVWQREIRSNYKALSAGKVLDIKRKVFLWYIAYLRK